MNNRKLISRLNDISIKLSNEKNVDQLLQMILECCIDLTNSDAGSIYTVLDNELHFEYTVNKSVEFPFKKFIMPVDKQSISGNCVLNKQAYNLKKMSDVKFEMGIEHNDSFDRSIKYKTINMLAVPLKNYEDEVIGVMQLINKKEENSTFIINDLTEIDLPPYTELDVQVTSSLASQAAILIERTRLHEELTILLDSVILTLSTALEQRDPVTAGHSKRVAGYSVSLAEEVNSNQVEFKNISFSENKIKELQIAALLHDVGKIGVPEAILQKRNRLSDEKIGEIEARYYLFSELLIDNCQNDFCTYFIGNVETIISHIKSINESNFLNDEDKEFLNELRDEKPIKFHNKKIKFLKDIEYKNLSILKGNLTDEERNSINMHAKHSGQILEGIDWGTSMDGVTKIVYTHHEKLNGKGYPFGLNGSDLAIAERILPIVDIYDALTARDRPYKPAMSSKKAEQILMYDVKDGALDSNLVDLFINKVINNTQGEN